MRSLTNLQKQENKMTNIENLLDQLIKQQKSTAWNLNRIAISLEKLLENKK